MLKRMIEIINYFVLRHLGISISRYHKSGWHQLSEFNFDYIIDVGVNTGTPELYKRFLNSNYLLIDPMESVFLVKKDLVAKGIKAEAKCIALGNATGNSILEVDPSEPGRSSLNNRTPLTAISGGTSTKTVKVTTLDEVIDEKLLRGQTLLKIDTEGHELKILEGAKKTLRNIDMVICEVSILERFVDGHSFDDLYSFLRLQGFEIRFFLNCYPDAEGNVRYADIAFAKINRQE